MESETAAFARRAEVHRPRLQLVAARMVGDAAEAEDIVQESLLRAYLGQSQLRDPERFGAWLVGIVLNVARMALRRRVAYDRALARVAAAPVALADEPDDSSRVRDALAVLPSHERDVVVLHYVDGLACDEVAAVLHTTPGAVRVRLHRARARLRDELEPTIRTKEITMIEMRLDDVLVRMEDDETIAGDQRIVVLRDESGERMLPIWIHAAEGNSLAVKLRGETTPRPMTSDLLAQIVQRFGARVERVVVTRLHEKTFYASITLAVDGSNEELDARPSDALNLAVRTSAPIFVEENVLDEAAVGPDELQAKIESESGDAGWRSLSAELLRRLHAPPK